MLQKRKRFLPGFHKYQNKNVYQQDADAYGLDVQGVGLCRGGGGGSVSGPPWTETTLMDREPPPPCGQNDTRE